MAKKMVEGRFTMKMGIFMMVNGMMDKFLVLEDIYRLKQIKYLKVFGRKVNIVAKSMYMNCLSL